MTGTQITFNCASLPAYSELPFYNFTTNQLDSINSIIIAGLDNVTSGPFTTIPPNICMLTNLTVSHWPFLFILFFQDRYLSNFDFQSLTLSRNQIQQADPTGVAGRCLSSVTTIDMSFNQMSEFPSALIYNMSRLRNLYFQNNRLLELPSNAFRSIDTLRILDFSNNNLTNLDLWITQVNGNVNLNNNQITTVTNKYFFTDFTPVNSSFLENPPQITLNGNGPLINFTDRIYEIYSQCREIQSWVLSGDINPAPATLTYHMSALNLGSTRIICSCDQTYMSSIISMASVRNFNTPLGSARCTEAQNSTRFIEWDCDGPDVSEPSTADFLNSYPRLCKIHTDSSGNLTVANRIPPTINPVSFYPEFCF